MAAVAAAAAVTTVLDGILLCDIPNANPYQGRTSAVRVATDLFADSFDMAREKTVHELDEDLKAFADLPANAGRLRFAPAVRTKLKAFMFWIKEEYRMNRNPEETAFPVGELADIMTRSRTHDRFMKDEKLMKAAKPKDFTTETKWADWEPTLVNYLRQIPGRDGVPLSYIIRVNDESDPTPADDFMDEYVANAPLEGDAFNIDKVEVATLIKSFLVGNTEAETKVQTLSDQNNGRAIYTVLQENYAGRGIFAIDMADAESNLDSLYYNGEKRPYMWWTQFERKLKWSYAVIDRREGRGGAVYSDARKIKRLLEKRIKADFLAETKAMLLIQLSQVPMRLTFDQALAALRASVQAIHPEAFSEDAAIRNTRRHINAATRTPAGRGRGRGRGNRGNGAGRGYRGRGGHHSHHNHNPADPKRSRSDSEIVTLKNGKRIEYHASFRFPDDVIRQFPTELYERMKNERQEYKKKRYGNNGNNANDMRSQAQEIASAIVSEMSRGGATTPPRQIQTANDGQSQLSQVSTGQEGSTMFGGRNNRVNRN